MIRYLELTAPEKSEFRQAKILSVEVDEGSSVKEGEPLFIVQSGKNEIPLPSTKDGKVVELIAGVGDNISLLTPLMLFETVVEDDQAGTTKKTPEEQDKQKEKQDSNQEKDQNPSQSEKKTRSSRKRKSKSIVDTSKQLDLIDANNQETFQQEKRSMNDTQEVTISVPDIGADSAKVTDILISVGDTINVDDSIVTLESDKASMDVPSPSAGVVASILVSQDQDVSEGSALITLTTTDADAPSSQAPEANTESKTIETSSAEIKDESLAPVESAPVSAPTEVEVRVPDIGGDAAKVIELHVGVGDEISIDQEIATLESDKASMDVPSPSAGVITEIIVAIDDNVEEGTLLLKVLGSEPASDGNPASAAQSSAPSPAPSTEQQASNEPPASKAAPALQAPKPAHTADNNIDQSKKLNTGTSHATPSIRKLARELGVDLSKVKGTGRKGRISSDDLKSYVKSILSGATAGQTSGGSGIPAIPDIDFSKFGPVETLELNKIKRLTATNLHRAWVNVPHVTHHDEANARQIETLRKGLKDEYAAQGIKISPLAFIIKSCVAALKEFPTFNSSLHSSGEHLILKSYYNIGIAVDTPNGLVVPVIKDADKKSIKDISQELADLSSRARDKKLTPKDLQGATFSISSLGGIGGRFFTPIVNAPEVAILGVSRTKISPEWNGQEFVPTPMLPLSLSYDHRVIDGAEAARFSAFVTEHIKTFNID